MRGVLVDSNVLLDVMTEDRRWAGWSSSALARAAEIAPLILNAVIYAEISVRFNRIEDLDAALPAAMFEREEIPFEAAFLAGKAFLAYRRKGGRKSVPLPDFFIGAHAAVAGYRLLTRDARRYRTYFPRIEIVSPEA